MAALSIDKITIQHMQRHVVRLNHRDTEIKKLMQKNIIQNVVFVLPASCNFCIGLQQKFHQDEENQSSHPLQVAVKEDVPISPPQCSEYTVVNNGL